MATANLCPDDFDEKLGELIGGIVGSFIGGGVGAKIGGSAPVRGFLADETGGAPVRSGVKPYEVDNFNELKGNELTGDGLDIHHVVQTQPAKSVIPGYNRGTAPAIALPEAEHALLPTRKGSYTGNPRELLASDIRDLRTYTRAPNSALQELIRLNKQCYPGAFNK